MSLVNRSVKNYVQWRLAFSFNPGSGAEYHVSISKGKKVLYQSSASTTPLVCFNSKSFPVFLLLFFLSKGLNRRPLFLWLKRAVLFTRSICVHNLRNYTTVSASCRVLIGHSCRHSSYNLEWLIKSDVERVLFWAWSVECDSLCARVCVCSRARVCVCVCARACIRACVDGGLCVEGGGVCVYVCVNHRVLNGN